MESQLFSYERLILILLHVVGDHNQDDFVRRIAIYLLNSLACQVDGKFKQLVGSLGAIEVSSSGIVEVVNFLSKHIDILDDATADRRETKT